jgi:hypothetical protein
VPVHVTARPPVHSAAEAATLIAPPLTDLGGPVPPSPAASAPTMFAHPAGAAALIAVPPGAQATTLMGPSGFSLASSSAPTMFDDPSRRLRADAMRSPGASASSTAWIRPPRTRMALAVAGLVGLALASFLIALAARGRSRPPVGDPAAITAVVPPGSPLSPSGAAPPLDAAPLDAAPLDAAPLDAAPLDAAPPPDAAAVMATLEIRTEPDGAMLTIAGQAHAAPAAVSLAPGRYFVDAELDGWMPERRSVELTGGERVVQEIVFTMRLRRGGRGAQQPGRLIARTTPPSDVFLGKRRMARTPFDMELDPGTYTLVFKHPRRGSLTRRVTITAGKTTKLTVALP